MIAAFYYEPRPAEGYAEPFNVAFFPDFPTTMTVLPSDDERVKSFVEGGGAIGPYQPPVITERVPSEISDRQFFQQLAVEKVITEDEAEAAVGTGAIPAAMEALIEQLPAEQQFPARMLVRGATVLRREHPVTNLIGSFYGWDAAKIDHVWRNASKL